MYKKYKVLEEFELSGINGALKVGDVVIFKAEEAVAFLDAKKIEEVVE